MKGLRRAGKGRCRRVDRRSLGLKGESRAVEGVGAEKKPGS